MSYPSNGNLLNRMTFRHVQRPLLGILLVEQPVKAIKSLLDLRLQIIEVLRRLQAILLVRRQCQ